MKRLLCAVSFAIVAFGVPALADPPQTGVIKDRDSFMPKRQFAAVDGKIIAVVLPGGKEIGALDGWGGPADTMVVAHGRNSYRKTYIPSGNNPQVTGFSVPVGKEGKMQQFAALNVLNPRDLMPWGITQPYTLAEVTVNDGQGSPVHDCFVATAFKVVEGTKDYPLKVTEVITNLKKKHADFLKEKNIDKEISDLAAKTLKDKKLTGPRETSDLMYVTWVPESETLLVRFKTKISDGAYTITKGPVNPKLPIDPRLPPGKGKAIPGGNDVPFNDEVPVLRVAPPRDFSVKTGTTISIELGQSFEVNKKGEITRIDELPIATSTQQINQPVFGPGPGPIGPRPVPLPVPPQKVQPDLE
jgi:hypothetical protein